MNRFEAIAAAKQSVQGRVDEWTDNALFSILRYGNRKWEGQDDARYGMCHAGVRDLRQPTRKDARYVVSAINRRTGYSSQKADVPSAKKWLDYVMNRSPYACAFFEKDVEKAWEEHCVVLYVKNIPGNLVQGALIATRMTWEYGRVVNSFAAMVDRGVEETTAFMVAHVLVSKPGSTDFYAEGNGSQHTALAVEEISLGWGNFKANTPSLLKPHYPKGEGSSDSMGVHGTFSQGTRPKVGSLKSHIVRRIGQLSSTVVETNPFVKAKPVSREEHRYCKVDAAVQIAKELEELHA